MDTKMTPAPLARTCLHHWHAAHGARFAESDGWLIVQAYVDPEQEITSVNHGPGLVDISAFAKRSLYCQADAAPAFAFEGSGPALPLRSVTRLAAGDGVLACRLTPEQVLVLAAATGAAALDGCLARVRQQNAILENDVTSALAGFALLGPRGRDLLRHLTSLDVSAEALPPGSCAETSIAGIHALLVCPARSRQEFIQIYIAWDLAEYLWERVLETGKRYGIVPMGLEAWRRLCFGPDKAET
jgi:glycine cleavage system aminomethyltransferase T